MLVFDVCKNNNKGNNALSNNAYCFMLKDVIYIIKKKDFC